MFRLLVALLLLVVSIDALAIEVENVEFVLEEACDSEHKPYGGDKLKLSLTPEALVVSGWTSVNCIEMVGNPVVNWRGDTITLSLDAISGAPGIVAGCNCTERFVATIPGHYSSGMHVYLVVGRGVRAHEVAP